MIDSGEALALTLYLLPGLIGLFVLETLVEQISADNLRRLTVVVTIAFLAVAIIVTFFGLSPLPLTLQEGKNTKTVDFNDFLETSFALSCVMGGILGVAGAAISNRDFLNKFLNRLVGTTKTGKMDVWHQVFKSFDKKWCRVRFKSGDILIGYPKFHPMNREDRELFIGNATWHRKVGTDYIANDVKGFGVLLTDLNDIEAIEIID